MKAEWQVRHFKSKVIYDPIVKRKLLNYQVRESSLGHGTYLHYVLTKFGSWSKRL